MGHCFKLTALLAVSVIAFSSASADDARTDEAKLQGTWKGTSAINDGNEVDDLANSEFIITEDTLVMKGKRTYTVKFKLDPSKNPKHIVMNFIGEKGEVIPSRAIYKIEGNTLTICSGEIGKPRPTEFKSVAGSKRTLIILVKAKE